jgi:hypothetical protein
MAFLFQLRAAKTVNEVVAAVKDYLRVWDEVLYRLPEAYRPTITNADDIIKAAEMMTKYRQRLQKSGVKVSHELAMTADFFAAAAARIKDLRNPK